MSAPAIYSPLPDDSFRILRIISSNENNLTCKLEHFTFDHPPEYTALSYAWGLPETTTSITCNGQAFPVTPHLLEALRQLYSLDPNGGFWIDAICINQVDNEEKAIHTRKMSSVYRFAKLVFVWLGQAENNSDLAFERIESLSNKFEPILRDGTPENIAYIKGWMDNDELTSSGLPSENDPIWHSLGFIYSQTWFARLWILQEVVLAKKIVVAHGTKRIDWGPLLALSKTFSRAALFGVMTGTSEKQKALRKGTFGLHLCEIAQGFQDIDHFTKMPPLLRICRQRDVTEPVDRIFGVLGMISHRIADQIEVDYSPETRRDWWKPYIQYGRLQLKSEGMLALLSLSASKDRPSELPSWCPNFNSPPKDAFNFAGVMGYQAGFELWEERIDSRVISVPDSNNLKFPGFRIDQVLTVVGSPEHCYSADKWRGPGGTEHQLLQYESKCLELSQQTYKLPDQVPDAHWRTLVADLNFNGQTPLEPEVFEDYLRLKKQWVSHSGENEEDYVFTMTPSERQRTLAYYQSIEGKKTRTFFSTHGGRVGLGPCDLQAGDVICVLYGGSPLFVLRYKIGGDGGGEEVAQLIGDTYVHGLMDLRTMPRDTRGEDEYFTIG